MSPLGRDAVGTVQGSQRLRDHVKVHQQSLDGGRFPAATNAISGSAEELLRAGFASQRRGVSAVHALEGAQEQQRGRRWGGNRIYIEIHGENLCLQTRVT